MGLCPLVLQKLNQSVFYSGAVCMSTTLNELGKRNGFYSSPPPSHVRDYIITPHSKAIIIIQKHFKSDGDCWRPKRLCTNSTAQRCTLKVRACAQHEKRSRDSGTQHVIISSGVKLYIEKDIWVCVISSCWNNSPWNTNGTWPKRKEHPVVVGVSGH